MSSIANLRGLASNLRPRLGLTHEGFYYLLLISVVLVGAVVRQINLLILLFGMLGLPMALSWWVVRASLRELQVDRKLPPTLHAGDTAAIEVELTNPRSAPSWSVTVADVLAREAPSAHVESAHARILFGYVPAKGSRQGVYRGRIAERGRYRFGPLRVSTSFPLGLLRYTLTVGKVETLLVLPRLGRLGSAMTRFAEWAELGHESVKNRQGAMGNDFYGLREWRTGDSRRLIHWRTSARRQDLYVRQFERPRKPDVALVIELWRPERPTEVDLERVEQAISFAATVLMEVARRGSRRVYLGTAGRVARFDDGPASPLFVREVLESLAVAEGASNDRLSEVLIQTLDAVRPDARVMVVSTRSIQLNDPNRFEALWTSPRRRSQLAGAKCIEAARLESAEYFAHA